jgi:glycosyltransferase involved in cell wall biosynthesis
MKVVWGIRASNMDLSRYNWLTRFSYKLERHLSWRADKIIANSQAGRAHAIENGFPAHKTLVIPNGMDTDYFRFSAKARQEFRKTLGLNETEILVGLVGWSVGLTP